MTEANPRVSAVIPAYNKGSDIIPSPDRLPESVTFPCEVAVIVDFPEDTTMPVLEKYAGYMQPTFRTVINEYGRGPANAIRNGIDVAGAGGAGVTMADAAD